MNKNKLMTVLLEPRVTEKTTKVGDLYNQYVFKVIKNATKADIKAAVEAMFDGAKVHSVQTSNVKGKRKSFARKLGQRANWKKAYVKLQPGYSIDFVAGN